MSDETKGAVADVQKGAFIWTMNAKGTRVVGTVIQTSKTPVPPDHVMVKLVLNDGRTLLVSPGHPTIDNRIVGDLRAGELYDGARILSADRVSYAAGYTYDILPSGETGEYWADGVLLGSTLFR